MLRSFCTLASVGRESRSKDASRMNSIQAHSFPATRSIRSAAGCVAPISPVSSTLAGPGTRSSGSLFAPALMFANMLGCEKPASTAICDSVFLGPKLQDAFLWELNQSHAGIRLGFCLLYDRNASFVLSFDVLLNYVLSLERWRAAGDARVYSPHAAHVLAPTSCWKLLTTASHRMPSSGPTVRIAGHNYSGRSRISPGSA